MEARKRQAGSVTRAGRGGAPPQNPGIFLSPAMAGIAMKGLTPERRVYILEVR